MKLHENKALYRQAVQFTADQMNIPALYIEKDYWVTYALSTIFKGGTVYPLCNEDWGVRRFFVKGPNGETLNIHSHKKIKDSED